MEENVTHTVKGLKNWFLVILLVPIVLFLFYSLTGAKTFHQNWPLANLTRYQLTVKFENDRPITNVGSTPVYSTYGRDDYQKNISITGSDKNANSSVSQSERGNFTAVILLTYMRSGSSLAGDVLQQPTDAFYMFEPLKDAEQIKMRNGSISFLNGTVMTNGSYDLQTVYLETLLGLLTCNFSGVYLESLLDTEFLSFGNNLKPYVKCINKIKLEDFADSSHSVLHNATTQQQKLLKDCLGKLRNICLHSKYRIVKTIRTKMSLAAHVLEQVVESKVMHLVRDPRATIESKSHRKVCPLGLTLCISQHCRRVREDSVVKARLEFRSPERVHTVLYEDIASRPIQTAKRMYEFIGMKLTPVISEYVHSITLGKNKSGCSVCKAKWQIGKSASSSRTHVDAWKQKLPSKYINRTQVLCNDIIRQYGYEYHLAPYRRKSKVDKVSMNKVLQNVVKHKAKGL